MVDRFFQLLLMVSSALFSWLGMMVVHEFGHVLHLWLTGGRVQYVLLHPLALSYTQPATNPHPLIVAAGGVIWGCLLPLALYLAMRRWAARLAFLGAFFAGFCFVANGAYLLAGALTAVGDGGELVSCGAPRWLLILAGLFIVDGGLDLWSGLGHDFGRAEAAGRVDRLAALVATIALVVLVTLELWLSPL
ncbi:MAG TPA: hypothetical protein EYP56_19590 [Planctomycetaceae bacterium]|nr:hypothetical protein [Planctomycetaceae bacterium]HIQ22863.1 hypothetical protein [Planctomycetota bacterium]